MKKQKFPAVVYAVVEDEVQDFEYPVLYTEQAAAIEAAGNGGKVAVYQLDRVLTAEIKHGFRSQR